MELRPLGTSDLRASAVAFGAWALGGWRWGGADERTSIDALKAGLDAGINFIDTAPAYGFGVGEEIVGKAIAGRRDQVVIATKCGLIWDEPKGAFFFASDDKGRKDDAIAESRGQGLRDVARCGGLRETRGEHLAAR